MEFEINTRRRNSTIFEQPKDDFDNLNIKGNLQVAMPMLYLEFHEMLRDTPCPRAMGWPSKFNNISVPKDSHYTTYKFQESNIKVPKPKKNFKDHV